MPSGSAVARDSIRILAGILFLIGSFWALFAWIYVAMFPSMVLMLLQHTNAPEPLELLAGSGLALQSGSGYLIWAGWFLIATGLNGSARWFWGLAALHEGIWILLWSFADPVRDLMLWYSVFVALACLIAAISNQNQVAPESAVQPLTS